MATFKGVITAISPKQSGVSKTGKQWERIDVVLAYNQSKPEFVKAIVFSVMNDNIEKFAFMQTHEYEVEVDFSVREYNGKHYMSASCWKATALNAAPQTQYQPPVQQQINTNPPQTDDDSQLPF